VYYIKASGADTTVFGTGRYALQINMGTATQTPVASPNTTTAASGPGGSSSGLSSGCLDLLPESSESGLANNPGNPGFSLLMDLVSQGKAELYSSEAAPSASLMTQRLNTGRAKRGRLKFTHFEYLVVRVLRLPQKSGQSRMVPDGMEVRIGAELVECDPVSDRPGQQIDCAIGMRCLLAACQRERTCCGVDLRN
jgi:hypothetical protein